MPAAVRHLVAILLLPFVVAVVVPQWIVRSLEPVDSRWPAAGPLMLVGMTLGAVLIIAGVALAGWCIALFARVGKGTLAPWDPTSRLVAVGPYRYTRNPMISGVAAILAGQALLTGSRLIALWFGIFMTVNQLYFVLSEEPGLEKRFGDEYRAYKGSVPRWIPRRPR
ncbi:MAG TPA: isoprenylcysteine carboxylmethyltransferase family protein [Gemmatimonadaceae bacterium]|jgi:protein-S-isoprenylcysteine O-methyltransferase Ste14|nr:isoprenylcysteine carboxylmethyltransferase family protein [Gemmatimonadaceae bacterium]